jgi:Rho termination factor-like protein
MPQVQRILHATHPATGVGGPHMIGETAVEFDADGFAQVDDPAVLEAMTQWPEAFSLMERSAPPGESLPESAAVRHLETQSVRELQDLAGELGVSNIHRRNKRELIDAIVAVQQAREQVRSDEPVP